MKLLLQHWEHFILWQPFIQTPSLTNVILYLCVWNSVSGYTRWPRYCYNHGSICFTIMHGRVKDEREGKEGEQSRRGRDWEVEGGREGSRLMSWICWWLLSWETKLKCQQSVDVAVDVTRQKNSCCSGKEIRILIPCTGHEDKCMILSETGLFMA